MFADFKRNGTNTTLAGDLVVGTRTPRHPLPPPSTTAGAAGGYTVELQAPRSHAGKEAELSFQVAKDGQKVKTQRYLGAGGHLVALRERDLAFLHVHPSEHDREGAVTFETEFPTAASYRLFLQFKHEGEVRTVAFTRAVAR